MEIQIKANATKWSAASPNLTETNLLSEANIPLFAVKKSSVYWSF